MQLPSSDCALCPRLVAFREANEAKFPEFFNGAVPSYGPLEAGLLVVGLAPGLKGANATGRPFTGDYAGDVLYPALVGEGLAKGEYKARPDDGLELVDVRITNAARCVPPENKPTTQEIATCNPFLTNEILGMPMLKVVLSLGGVSHKAVLKALGYKQSYVPFVHGQVHALERHEFVLLDTYHTSRYNVNTGRLTYEMFAEVIKTAKGLLNT